MKSASPYLNFAGNTESAFNYYRSVFGGEFTALMRFRDIGDNSMGIPESDLDKIAHVALPLAEGCVLMGTDTLESLGQQLNVGNNFYITIEPDSAAEAQSLFVLLSDGGKVEMPLNRTDWAELHGITVDRFGVQWMIDYAGSAKLEHATA